MIAPNKIDHLEILKKFQQYGSNLIPTYKNYKELKQIVTRAVRTPPSSGLLPCSAPPPWRAAAPAAKARRRGGGSARRTRRWRWRVAEHPRGRDTDLPLPRRSGDARPVAPLAHGDPPRSRASAPRPPPRTPSPPLPPPASTTTTPPP